MRKYFKNIAIISVVAGVSLLTACTNNFEETNIDPNRLQEISPATLLNPMLYEVASDNMYRSWSQNSLLMQGVINFPATATATSIQHYNLSDNIGSSAWNNYYRYFKNASDMEKAAIKFQDANYQAIAITLKVWMMANLVDLFGDVPYLDAAKGEQGKFYPAFDDQEKIYEDLFVSLEKANALYDLKRTSVYFPDILFSNDMKRWQKFTNSLHLRLLLRVSNRVEKQSYQKMLALLNDPVKYPIIESSAEEATLQITGISPNVSPWGRIQDFTLSKKMGAFFIDNLNDFDDPRLAAFATQATKMIDGKKVSIGYRGIPSAYDGPDSQFDYEASTLNNAMAAVATKTAILTYAEIQFIKAELAQKGYLNDAVGYYNKAVTAAISFYGLTVPANYFDNPKTSYDGTLERIMLQKYYALYMNDYQQWFEHKRTGFPVLPKTNAMQNNGQLPSRFSYPLDIRTKNKTNYEKVIQKLGSDDINLKTWWQN